ncbi:hypothetical protein WJX72_010669 [[Myrmecia] bisecta]|uniref:TauD/TfdA-like domain-containing protein n=1 Tax=[Myrmecia] bisecta TaxID=41462 RepID=A0AAW1PIG7_9CHLO
MPTVYSPQPRPRLLVHAVCKSSSVPREKAVPAALQVVHIQSGARDKLLAGLLGAPLSQSGSALAYHAHRTLMECLPLEVAEPLHSYCHKWDTSACGILIKGGPLDPSLPATATPVDGRAPPTKHTAVTRFADVFSIVRQLDHDLLAELRKPLYCFRFSAGRDGDVVYGPWQPVLSGPEAAPQLTVNFWDPRALTPGAEAALERLQEVLDMPEVQTCVRLAPGDLLLLDNRRTVHARSAFVPRFDGQDRWLQRLWGRATTWDGRSEGMTNPLVFD